MDAITHAQDPASGALDHDMGRQLGDAKWRWNLGQRIKNLRAFAAADRR